MIIEFLKDFQSTLGHPAGSHELVPLTTCWIQSEVDKVVGWSGSNKIHFVSEWYWSLVLLLPLHNQLTLRDPPTLFKVISILPGDLGQNTMCIIFMMVCVSGPCMSYSQWGERMVLFSNHPLSLVHHQECSK